MRNIVIIAAAIAVLFSAAGTASAHSRHHQAPAPRAQAYYVAPVRHLVVAEPGAFVCDINPWQTPFQCGNGGSGQ